MTCPECEHGGVIEGSYGASCSACGTKLEPLPEESLKNDEKKIYDIIWKKEGKDKTTWERIGVLIEKNGKKYIKLVPWQDPTLIPHSSFLLVVV